jgi:hypothetical protein
MKSQKVLGSIQAATLLLSPLFATSGFRRVGTIGKAFATNEHRYIADGGAPVPPYPPQMTNSTIVIADGGAPVPPYPPQISNSTIVIADGGAPVPPYPPQITNSTIVIADGGARFHVLS